MVGGQGMVVTPFVYTKGGPGGAYAASHPGSGTPGGGAVLSRRTTVQDGGSPPTPGERPSHT